MHAILPIQVALDLPLRAGDEAFTFGAPGAETIPRGSGVVVPFGRRLLPGIVLGEGTRREDLRSVLALVAGGPLVPEPVLDLALWTAREYLSSAGEALAAALPWEALWAGLRVGCEGDLPNGLPGEAAAALEGLRRRPASLTRAGRLLLPATDAIAHAPGAPCLTARLASAQGPEPCPTGFAPGSGPALAEAPCPEARPPVADGTPAPPPRLDEAVVEALAGGPRAILVAGWRRMPAYAAAIRRALGAGLPAVAAFGSLEAAARFFREAQEAGLPAVLLHGELEGSERLAAWRRLRGRRDILVVGTRSVAFAPLADPALVIVDDYDGSGHKEERSPRYLTGSVAARRVKASGVAVLGSATPTTASYHAVRRGELRLITVASPRPRIGVIDLRGRSRTAEPLSRPLLHEVRRVVRAGGRAVLIADRKGYAGGLLCGECGAVERCARCGVALPYDRAGRRLWCRICGAARGAPEACTACGAPRLLPIGAGTERLAAHLRRYINQVRVFDAGPAGTPRAAELLVRLRSAGGAVVATTALLPYLEELAPGVVGFASADRLLHRPEFRASERALALLRSVGMAARAPVLVETADPENPALRAAAGQGLRQFYEGEIARRSALGYPPFCTLVAVTVTGRSLAAADAVGRRIVGAAASRAVEALGPVQAPPAAHRGEPARAARLALMLKCPDRASARALLWPYLTGAGMPRGVGVSADVDPHSG